MVERGDVVGRVAGETGDRLEAIRSESLDSGTAMRMEKRGG